MWPPSERPSGCASELELVQHQLGEIDPGSRATLEGHLGGCSRCRELMSELDRERARFAAAPMPIGMARTPPTPGRHRNRITIAAGLVAVAAALMLWLRSSHEEPDNELGARTKGHGAHATIYLERSGEIRPAASGDRVAPGDRVRVVVRATSPIHVALLAIDGSGQASVYLPAAGHATIRLPAGDAVPIPGAVELDQVLGDERLFVLTCEAETPLANIVRALPSPPLPTGCRLDTVTLDKRAAGSR